MSFLDELRSKKNKLKPSVTTITYPDGTQTQLVTERSESGDIAFMTEEKSNEANKCGFVIDTKPDLVPACIIPGIYLGSQDSVSPSNFEEYQITHVLSVGIETPLTSSDKLNVQCYFLPCLDLPETELNLVLEQAFAIMNPIREKGGRVLVHCNAGVSRSSTLCIAYLMRMEGMTFERAFQLVKSKRECIRPNDGFLKQLKMFK